MSSKMIKDGSDRGLQEMIGGKEQERKSKKERGNVRAREKSRRDAAKRKAQRKRARVMIL